MATGFPNGIDIGGAGSYAGSGAPSSVSGANRGASYVDTVTGLMYRNVGSKTSQSWRAMNQRSGMPSHQYLRASGNVVGGQTVTIGTQVFRFAVVNTDSGQVVAGGKLANTDAEIDYLAFPSHGLIAGDLLRVENEIMRVLDVRGTGAVRVKRGVSNTTVASHANGTAIFREATPGQAAAGAINVGVVTTLTPTVWTDALIADINGGRANYRAFDVDNNTVFIVTAESPGGVPAPSADAFATTETMTNAAFDGATAVAGYVDAAHITLKIVPTAAEVTAGIIKRAFPFTPVIVTIEVVTTATRARKAWDGAAAVSGNVITIDNAGATDWAATDEIILVVRGS